VREGGWWTNVVCAATCVPVAAMGSAGWRQAGQLVSRSSTRGAHASQYSAWPHAKRTERGAS